MHPVGVQVTAAVDHYQQYYHTSRAGMGTHSTICNVLIKQGQMNGSFTDPTNNSKDRHPE